jgi:hypothetical protein
MEDGILPAEPELVLEASERSQGKSPQQPTRMVETQWTEKAKQGEKMKKKVAKGSKEVTVEEKDEFFEEDEDEESDEDAED